MIASVQILVGCACGCGGFLFIGENPLVGGCALLLSGFFILAGIDHVGRAGVHVE